MTTATLAHLCPQSLSLPIQERAELARCLLASLDGPADEGDESIEAAWGREIRRRVAEVRAGQATLIDRAEFDRRMQARLDAP